MYSGPILQLIVRGDSTYDYLYAPGMTDANVVHLLRQVADQIVQGAHINNGQPPGGGGS